MHVVPAYYGAGHVFGGAERYAFELARALARRTPTRLVSFAERPLVTRVGELRVELLRNWARAPKRH